MLRAVEIDTVPEGLQLLDYSADEMARASKKEIAALVQVSPSVWRIENEWGETILVAGLFMPHLIGGAPELWVLACRALRKTLRKNVIDLRTLVRQLTRLHPTTFVQVDAEYPTGQRFAEFMGFTRRHSYSLHNGREFIVYEVRNWQ